MRRGGAAHPAWGLLVLHLMRGGFKVGGEAIPGIAAMSLSAFQSPCPSPSS